MEGKNNSDEVTAYGIRMVCAPNPEFEHEIIDSIKADSNFFPYDYYTVRFSTFADEGYSGYKKRIRSVFIDSSNMNSDYATNDFVKRMYAHYTDKCYDRPDTFLFYLNDFYEHKERALDLLGAGKYLSNSIFKEALQSFNFADLYSFLVGFENVYEYCRFFYGMEREFVDRMIEEGKRPITVDEDLRRYIELAKDFWQLQVSIIEEKEKS